MKNESAFWRLLGEYERLCVDEAVALRDVNLAALARLQNQKSVVGRTIATFSADVGSERSSDQVGRVIAKQKQNLLLAQEQLARMECERQNLTTASQRLESFGKAYKPKPNRCSKLQTEG